MESIKELRVICQSTRPAIYKDFLSKFYYKISIYFTWLCLFFRLSANQVTLLSGIVAIMGGVLLSSSSPIIVFLGTICFHIFAILDMSDGEVARYRKQGGVSGHYLDWYMHFISSTSLLVGLFLWSCHKFSSNWQFALGVVAIVIPILDKSIQNAGWTVICWTRLRDKKNGNIDNMSPGDTKECISEMDTVLSNKPYLFQKIIKRTRFLLLSPLQDHWAPIMLTNLALIDIFLSYAGFSFIDYRLIWIYYVGLVGPIYLALTLNKFIKNDALKKGYQRLFYNKMITLPEDDFLK